MGQVLGEIKMLCACKPCFPWCEGDPGGEERRLRSASLLPQYPPLCRDQGQNVRRPESPTRFFVLPQYPGSPLTSAPVQMAGLRAPCVPIPAPGLQVQPCLQGLWVPHVPAP